MIDSELPERRQNSVDALIVEEGRRILAKDGANAAIDFFRSHCIAFDVWSRMFASERVHRLFSSK